MPKLLVPIDGSDNAKRALEYALRLAKKCDPLEVHIVTVHPEPVVYGEIEIYVSREKIAEQQKKHSESILRPAIDAAKSAGVPHTGEILIGDIASMIADRAEELKCDGIVMGTRGMGAIGNLVMGSITTKVVHLTKLPVTLVK